LRRSLTLEEALGVMAECHRELQARFLVNSGARLQLKVGVGVYRGC
jgi:hypothetical protein